MSRIVALKKNYPYVLMVVPALAIFVTFFIVPLINTAYFSFFSWTNFAPGMTFNGLANYRRILGDSLLLLSIRNTLIFAFVTVMLQSMISLPISVLLNSKLKGSRAFRAIFFSPAVMSTLVVGYLWSFLLSSSDHGFVNILLSSLGLERVNFLGDGRTALISIIGISVWQWFGWSMVIYLGGLQTIGDELYEAASVDGASKLRQFWHITLPGLAPAIKVTIVTSTISGLRIFDIVFATTGGGPAHQTQTIMTRMFSSFSDGNFGQASAFGILFLLLSISVAIVMFGIFKRWEARLG